MTVADGWTSQTSVHREKAIEHLFLGQLSRHLLLTTGTGPEVLRAEHDSYGYDVVLEHGAILRHVQFKISRIDGKRAHVDVGQALAAKPGGCVIWLLADPATYEIDAYRWLGGPPGSPLPELGERPALHSKADSTGRKAARPGLRRVPRSRFERLDTIAQVAEALFGARNDQLLRAHLAASHADEIPTHQTWLQAVRGGCYAAIPTDLTFNEALGLAHLIDGYALAEAAGLGEPFTYADAALERAQQAREWRGNALELWTSLFLEHRRERFSNVDAPFERLALLDDLVQSLRAQLVQP